jgi:DNA helicase HerA-like ATPase
VKPKKYEKDVRIKKGLEEVFKLGIVTFFREEVARIPTFGEILLQIESYQEANGDKPLYLEALEKVKNFVLKYMDENNLLKEERITEDFIKKFSTEATNIADSSKMWKQSEVYSWLTTRSVFLEYIKEEKKVEKKEGLTIDEIVNLIENSETRIICISISEEEIIKNLAIELSRIMLLNRKKEFRTTPQVLFVFDEAQEFVPAPTGAKGIEKLASEEIERLLRQGRKYGLGGCIATQRIAYLNTNVMQQLHTYFVSTLPRNYDRNVVSGQFMIDKNIVDKTLEFVPGEWLLSSYVATGISNVPIFIKAENTEDSIEKILNSKIKT